jgi:4-hydroxythreonine-4-phosphate dehydrogenase
MSDSNIKVGISIGDINGIGVEVILKAFSDKRILDFMTPIIYGSSKVISHHKKALNNNELNYIKLDGDKEIKGKNIYIKNCWEEDVKITLGEATKEGGKYAVESLKQASKDLAEGKIDVLVTAPIHKHNVQSDEFNFPGHTEYLANMANVDKALMIMVGDTLKVAVVTGHIPLKDVSVSLTKDAILNSLEQLNNSLIKDFNIVRPKIAVLGLNPHAGDKGLLGEEEQNVITPAINLAKGKDVLAFGPYSADGFFGSASFLEYDAVLAMYHDQGLIPFKSISFGNGVNYTAGLPIVRTSPDHGTAFGIAGEGKASETSFRNALFLAVEIYQNRKRYKELNENPLQVSKKK